MQRDFSTQGQGCLPNKKAGEKKGDYGFDLLQDRRRSFIK